MCCVCLGFWRREGGSICNGMGPFLNKCIAICKKCVKQIKPTVLPLRRYIAGSPRDHREAKRARTYFLISVVIVFLTRGLRRGLQLDQRQHGGWRWEAGNVHELENRGRERLGLQHQMVTQTATLSRLSKAKNTVIQLNCFLVKSLRHLYLVWLHFWITHWKSINSSTVYNLL